MWGAAAQCFQFTQEHVDLLSVQWNVASNQLSLMASDDTHGLLYASNQCVVIAPESIRFMLPAGTPFGNEGDPLWILPQNPFAGAPCIGVSAESLPLGSFNDPLAIHLKRVEGPGQFIVWQTTGIGAFDIKMDARDGIGPDDKLTPFVGGHEHHNWGFTTSGVYRFYFQAGGQRPGQTTNLVSAETPFTFHVLPLKPFETWTAARWPCECRTNLILAGANPDGDVGANVVGYLVTDYYKQQHMPIDQVFFVMGSDVTGPMGKALVPVADRPAAERFLQDHHGSRILKAGEITGELLKDLIGQPH